MRNYKIYEKGTNNYIGTIELFPEELEAIEVDFLVKIAR